jgi:GNAT superfamily N-acetyltransferase
MQFVIRHAEPQDIRHIIEMCIEHAEYEKLPFDATGKCERLEEQLFQSQPRLYCLVVESGQEIVGYASFSFEFSTWQVQEYLHLDCLFLRPQVRGHGIGSQVMDFVCQFALKHGCTSMQWQTPPFNEGGIRFYHRIGATSRDKIRFYLDPQSRISAALDTINT